MYESGTRKNLLIIGMIIIPLMLSGCLDFLFGGGGNTSPLAEIRVDSTIVAVGSQVSLDGSESYDSDYDSLEYSWQFDLVPVNSELGTDDITDRNTQTAGFIPDVAGTYVIRLTVTDGIEESSEIIVITANTPPVASAIPDQPVNIAEEATLDGTGSGDEEGESLSFTWEFVSVPEGSSLNDSGITGNSNGTASFIPDAAGTYEIRLTVSDGISGSFVIITQLVLSNGVPEADAGDLQAVDPGSTVELDGTGSSDPDGDPLTYLWEFMEVPTGSFLTDTDLTGSNTASPEFIPDVSGDYEIQLTVSDGIDSDSDTVTVIVRGDITNPGDLVIDVQ